MQYPFVSIVVCTYNRSNYLDGCIKSLYKQTYQNREIIVVNGPSTDDTDCILNKFKDVLVIRQEKLNGLSYARNLGISYSKGDIIAFIDDDATADENWLKYLVDKYTNDSVGGVGGLVYGPQKSHIQFANGVINKCGIPNAVRDDTKKLRKGEFQILMGTNCSFKKSVLYEIGGFDPYFKYYHDESDLCTRVINKGYQIVYQRESFVIHDMVEGHNRKSPYDLNWAEIIKNVIYYTMKNFGNTLSSYTTRPVYSLYCWIIYFVTPFFNNELTLGSILNIYQQILKGAFRGYKDGLSLNLFDKNKDISYLDFNIENEKKSKKHSITEYPINIEANGLSNKLNIALLSQEYSKNCNGGICRYTHDLAHGLADLGNEVHIISKSENDREYDYMDENVFVHKINPQKIDFLPLSPEMDISHKNISYSYEVCLKLNNLIETKNIQVVEAPLWDAEGFVFSLIKNIPLVVRVETPLFKVSEIQKWDVNKDFKLANWMEGEAVRRADRVIAISSAIGKLICDHHNVSENNIDVSPLGIDLPIESQAFDDQDNDILEVLFVGRLEKRKGIDTLFRAIPAVVRRITNVRFTIVGSDTKTASFNGSYKKHLLNILDKKYHKYVYFIGYVSNDDLENYYRKCNIFVAPSLYESFGLIYLEAMAWGKPVIGCDVGGVPEIIVDGETGIIVPPDDASSLADAILELLVDEEKRKILGELAIMRMKKNMRKILW